MAIKLFKKTKGNLNVLLYGSRKFNVKTNKLLTNMFCFAKFTEHLCHCLYFNKVAGLRPATLLKKRLWRKCFTVNFAKFLRTPFLQNTSGRLLPNREQLVLLNGYTSTLANFKCGVPQGSMLGPLLFLIYIHDFHLAIKYSEVHHLADNTNLNFNSSLNPINKQVNHDLKNLANWLKGNKIYLNIDKT